MFCFWLTAKERQSHFACQLPFSLAKKCIAFLPVNKKTICNTRREESINTKRENNAVERNKYSQKVKIVLANF
jgi:hypothetical protein